MEGLCTLAPASSSGDREDALFDDVISGKLKQQDLERVCDNKEIAVRIRRRLIGMQHTHGVDDGLAKKSETSVDRIPYQDINYEAIHNVCCENVIGYVPIPLGVAGPLLVNGQLYNIPMATTEGCLVASVNRGCKAISSSNGIQAVVVGDGMTRAPCVSFPSVIDAAKAMKILQTLVAMQRVFNETTRYGSLDSVEVLIAGHCLYPRFRCNTGDAMGMNMVTKGIEKILVWLPTYDDVFRSMDTISISGNVCTDKKPSAVNWILGRGKQVVAEAVLSGMHDDGGDDHTLESVLRDVLKISVHDLVNINTHKNLAGSGLAGSIGGFNAQAANVVAAIYIATGQDPAQVVEGSMAMTNVIERDGCAVVSVTMPCIEVGTVGGGTNLPCQKNILDLLNLGNGQVPGERSRNLAILIASAVLAGGTLVSSHLRMNRNHHAIL